MTYFYQNSVHFCSAKCYSLSDHVFIVQIKPDFFLMKAASEVRFINQLCLYITDLLFTFKPFSARGGVLTCFVAPWSGPKWKNKGFAVSLAVHSYKRV